MFDAIAHNLNYFTATNSQEHAERNAVAGAEDLKENKSEEATQKTRVLAGQDETHPDGRKKDSLELSREAEEIRELQARDREVRAHEAAHASAGGSYAGAPSYTYERGADGQSYAVGGEVSIDVSPIPGDPAATMQKAQQVRAAALAPAEPSAQDMKVAQRAQSMAAKARSELATQETGKTEVPDEGASVTGTEGEISAVAAPEPESGAQAQAVPAGIDGGGRASLSYYA